ncbi:hypothetical protein HNV08_08050 [Winogradskyella eckloniae]|uniref:hypothetical protein n=1 Tax=Winogradskyella eckloniae TaxID=1089306 RepID=UPI001565EAB7|nr:hypothetical protein [Winogradskyella eckloniae]NRD19997.1 hypothetical protein [Winogradskyella eckloniae]
MKTAIKNLKCIMMCTLLLFVFGCSKEDDGSGPGDGEIEEVNGIDADDLENYGGDLGLLINTRDLVKKGYNPVKVNITTTAAQGNYDQELVVDPFTNIAQLKLSIDNLTEIAVDELRNGVGLEVEVLNPSDNVILSETYSVVSFEENGNQFDIDASNLEAVSNNLHFNGDMRYYLQLVDAGGNFENTIVWKPGSSDDGSLRLEERTSSFNRGVTSEQFYIYQYQNEDNTVAVYSAITNRYLRIGESTRTFRQSGAYSFPSTNPSSLDADLKFKVKKESNGLYTIRGASDNKPLRRIANGSDINWHTNDNGTIQYFRIISLDIDWQVTQLDTEYLQPILPAVVTSFGFNSTLKNCGSGNLEQQVGIEKDVTTTYTNAFSETIGLSSRVTTNVDVTVSATAETSFFGNGGSVTAEASAGLEVSTEASSSSTVSAEESVSETNTFFSNRIVTVPAGSASLVYDAYQTYSNVKVPYVKRLRLTGNHTEGPESMSGFEIATQLEISNFLGVITNIGSDFVEVTIKGNMYLNNIVDSVTEVRDVAANCN